MDLDLPLYGIAQTSIIFSNMTECPVKPVPTKPKPTDPPTTNKDNQQGPTSTKFLKRKPDHNKFLGSPSAKKQRQSSITRRITASPQPQGLSPADSRFITLKKSDRGSECGESVLLETARSENNLFMRKKELGMAISRVYQDASRLSKESFFSKQSQEPSLEPSLLLPQTMIDDYNHFGPHRKTSKKSRTQFFNLQLCSQMGKDEEGLSTQEQGEVSYERRRLLEECQSLMKKNKWLQEQVDSYAEKEYLLIVHKNHLEEQIKERDCKITALQRELAKQKDKGDDGRWKEELALISAKLAREQQRYSNLKEENDYMQTELIAKNEELIALFGQHAEQESRHRKERNVMAQRLQKMRAQVQKLRMNHAIESGQVGQAQRWKERALKWQQEVKYLQIQNQCLLIHKEDLAKCEAENRKLRDERDYFKQKVMEHIKRNRRLQELSRSENSSIVLQLSETSIEKK